jgi:hypothetical protein
MKEAIKKIISFIRTCDIWFSYFFAPILAFFRRKYRLNFPFWIIGTIKIVLFFFIVMMIFQTIKMYLFPPSPMIICGGGGGKLENLETLRSIKKDMDINMNEYLRPIIEKKPEKPFSIKMGNDSFIIQPPLFEELEKESSPIIIPIHMHSNAHLYIMNMWPGFTTQKRSYVYKC